MRFKQLGALLLCVAMLVCCFTACDENPTETTTNDNQPANPQDQNNQKPAKTPTTAKEYMSVACEKMLTEHYQETDVREGFMTVNGEKISRPTKTEVFICQGLNFYMEDEEGISIYLDDVFYFSYPESGIKNKYTVPESERNNPILHPTGEEAAWYQSVKFNSMTLGKDASGNVTITGKGAGKEAKAILEETFGQIPGFEIDYDTLEWVLTLDSEYRFISQCAKLSFLGAAGPMEITSTITYQYGAEYSVTAPEDADSYTEVDSFMDLFM